MTSKECYKGSISRHDIKGPNSRNNSFWKFKVDYNDHFETPLVAYSDIDPILSDIAQKLQKSREDVIIYDPYYCKGNMVEHLNSLGYNRVINNNSDFYGDIKRNRVPGKQ